MRRRSDEMRILTVIPMHEEFEFFVQVCAEQGLAMETAKLDRSRQTSDVRICGGITHTVTPTAKSKA
jgi:hypothetical protein